MTAPTLPDRPLRAADTIVRDTDGGVVAERTDVPVKVALNPTAFALWALCDGETDVSEMVSAVCVLFEITREQALRDVAHGINEMRTAGLVR